MKRVLVIDDDLMIGRLLYDHLSNEGFSVETSTLAEDGFKLATQKPPDLIMLDVNLPDATGFQMVGRFRQEAVTRSIPIIMMSGAARNSNQQTIGRQMGANDYILKPFDVVKVSEKIHALLGTKPVAKSEPAVEAKAPAVPEPVKEAPRPKAAAIELTPVPPPREALPPVAPLAEPLPEMPLPLSPEPSVPEISFPDPLPSMPALSTLSFAPPPTSFLKTTTSPEVKSSAEPVWYELPLGPVQEISEPPLIDLPSVPAINYTTQETAPIEAPAPIDVERNEPPEQLEAPIFERATEPASEIAPAPAISIPEHNGKPHSIPETPIFLEPLAPPIVKVAAVQKAPFSMKAPAWFSRWWFAWGVLAAHLLLFAIGAMITKAPAAWVLRGLSFTLGGWAFFLGVLVCASAVLRISLESRDAMEILGVAILPMIVRALMGIYTAFTAPKAFVHFMGESSVLPPPIFWSHPLDIFQVVSLAIVGMYLHRRPGASLQKVIGAVCVIGVAWALLGRGYFRPF